jgi:signal transduction histidine kinase
MNQLSNVRYILAVAPLVIIAGLYAALHGQSLRLLSAPPNGYLPVIMIVAAAVSIFSAMTFFANVGPDFLPRLARRLGTILILALTLYACAEASRGYYALTAFRGPLTTSSEQWEVANFGTKGSEIWASRAGLKRQISFPATAEALAAVTGLGSCIAVKVERSEGGVERVASNQPEITPDKLQPCPGSPHGNATRFQSNRSESAAEQAATAAIMERNERLRNIDASMEADDEERDDGVSFEPGQPMIDTSRDD